MSNHLKEQTSPYLLQHAENPVDWYPWGARAFEKARTEDKPVFLSIGYSTCHWCHVMAHESFEDDEIAGILNRSFVPVKVDKEERRNSPRRTTSCFCCSIIKGLPRLFPDIKKLPPISGRSLFDIKIIPLAEADAALPSVPPQRACSAPRRRPSAVPGRRR